MRTQQRPALARGRAPTVGASMRTQQRLTLAICRDPTGQKPCSTWPEAVFQQWGKPSVPLGRVAQRGGVEGGMLFGVFRPTS